MNPKVYIPQPIPDVALNRLKGMAEVEVFPYLDRIIDPDALLKAVKGKNYLYALGEIPYRADVIDAALPDLKGIAAMYIFPKFVDIKTATVRRVLVTGVPNMLVETTAEFTFALLITTAWRLPEQERILREGQWKQYQSMAMLGTRIYDKTLGIVGLGKIGTSLAKKAQGSGMRVIYNKRTRLSPQEEIRLNVEWRETEDLFREADFVALTPTLTPGSKGLVGERLLSLMKPTSILINTSRGAVVDEKALARALQDKRIRGAGLDVFERELPNPDPGPIPALLDLPNVVAVPHIGSAAIETREEMAMRTVDNIEAMILGRRPPDLLNPEVLGEAPRDTGDRIG
jgi:lactate dehydrogenase-like 2-hydroxyacid dehydrogenase